MYYINIIDYSVVFSDLADIMKRLLTKYDNLFEVSFPYSMGWHGECVCVCFSVNFAAILDFVLVFR